MSELSNPLQGEMYLELPQENGKPVRMHLKLTNRSFKIIEQMTGVPHFKRFANSKGEDFMSVDFVIAMLWAASRTHEPQTIPSLDVLNDIYDRVPVDQGLVIWGKLLTFFTTACTPPKKAEESPLA